MFNCYMEYKFSSIKRECNLPSCNIMDKCRFNFTEKDKNDCNILIRSGEARELLLNKDKQKCIKS